MRDGDEHWRPADLRALSLAEREALIQRALQRGRDERSKAAGALLDRLAVTLRGWASHRLAPTPQAERRADDRTEST